VRTGRQVDLVAMVRVRVVTCTVVTVVSDACDDVRRGGLRVFALGAHEGNAAVGAWAQKADVWCVDVRLMRPKVE